MMDIKVDQENFMGWLRWADRENFILDEIESKTVHKDEEGDR